MSSPMSAQVRAAGEALTQLAERAGAVHRELDGLPPPWNDELMRPEPRSAAKQIAVAALALHLREGVGRRAALRLSAEALGRSRGHSRALIKKNASEADAVLTYGLAPDAVAAVARQSGGDLLRELDALVRAVRVREAAQARARALRGARGGRPDEGGPLLRSVRRMIELAETGDAASRRRLRELARQLDLWRENPGVHAAE